jgi:hypothetical protein
LVLLAQSINQVNSKKQINQSHIETIVCETIESNQNLNSDKYLQEDLHQQQETNDKFGLIYFYFKNMFKLIKI